MDGVYDSVGDNINPIGVGGTNVVAQLLVARFWLPSCLVYTTRRVGVGIRTSWVFSEERSDVL